MGAHGCPWAQGHGSPKPAALKDERIEVETCATLRMLLDYTVYLFLLEAVRNVSLEILMGGATERPWMVRKHPKRNMKSANHVFANSDVAIV